MSNTDYNAPGAKTEAALGQFAYTHSDTATETARELTNAENASLEQPVGLQNPSDIQGRRWLVLILNAVTYGALLALAARVAGAGGWTGVDVAMFVAFAFGSPWAVLGFWNALIGLWLLHGSRNTLQAVAPFVRAGDTATPLKIKTAVLMTLRNEDPDRAIARLRAVKRSVDATGQGRAFSYFVLSDTNDADVAAREDAAIARWQLEDPDAERIRAHRRTDNKGYKAGNVREFLDRDGDDFEVMLPLDADSVMSGDAIVRMARMMQAHPRLGILQSLVVGMPSQSAFARIFQFGMRLGMRSYTMGQAWWVADCGPYWGHNALVRIAPFKAHCELPEIRSKSPLGGHVLSHDQVEATFMRRAGYEVRVIPYEMGSWEENPPTMLDFAKRDIRWCQGNMQYLYLVNEPGLKALSRFQLIWAMLMFVGIPAWTAIIALLPIAAWQAQAVLDFPTGLALTLYCVFFAMYLAPKIVGFVDVLLTKGEVARFGGTVRFVGSAIVELVFSFLQGAVSTIRTTVFMVGLAFGKTVTWGGQNRDAQGLTWAVAAGNLWPQMVFGGIVCGALAIISIETLLWSLPLTAGYLLAVPFAVVTASPGLGQWMQRRGLCAIPEDFDAPIEIRDVQGGVTPAAFEPPRLPMPVTGGDPMIGPRPKPTPIAFTSESR